MPAEFNGLSKQEQLKAENEFLKMKLMLENGAEFGFMETGNKISPEIENEFLNYIAAFEQQSANPKYLTVFEKIGRPAFFKAVAEIPDEEIDESWKKLDNYLGQYGISLDTCSPNISTRELYRFTTEELFKHEMIDMNLPGVQTGFIYDEFHPDPIYDNSRLVVENLLEDIFSKRQLFFQVHYAKTGFVFNQQLYEQWNQYFEKIAQFKSLFDEIELVESKVNSCIVSENECYVKGIYQAKAKQGDMVSVYNGRFDVKLSIGILDYWEFSAITIEGFNIG
ncbi:MAG: hypothetical protein ABI688_04035 [Bacteroidota bacterium]